MQLTPAELRVFANVRKGVAVAAGLDWRNLRAAFQRKDYAEFAEVGVEDALTIAQPWLPQAGTAKFVLHLAYTMARTASEGQQATGSFHVEDLIKGLIAAEGVDWKGYLRALHDGNAIVVAGDTGEILASLAAPFFPPAAIGADAFGALAAIGAFTHPAMPYSWPGYHWDALWGWVRDEG